MTKKDAIIYLILAALGIGGYFITGYPGGIMTGAACTMIFLAFVGRKVASVAAAKLDKNIQDTILNAKNQSYAPTQED